MNKVTCFDNQDKKVQCCLVTDPCGYWYVIPSDKINAWEDEGWDENADVGYHPDWSIYIGPNLENNLVFCDPRVFHRS